MYPRERSGSPEAAVALLSRSRREGGAMAVREQSESGGAGGGYGEQSREVKQRWGG